MSNTLSKTLGLGLPALAEMIRAKGRGKDTVLAHITPKEAALLKKRGGAGTINPHTGLLEYYDGEDYIPDEGDPYIPEGTVYDIPEYVPDEASGPYIPEGTVYEPNINYPEQAGPTYSEMGYTPQTYYPEQAGPTYNEMGYTPQPQGAPINFTGTSPSDLQRQIFSQETGPGNWVMSNQGTPYFVPAALPDQIGYGGVTGAQPPSPAGLASQYVEQDTEQQSRDAAGILSRAGAAAKKAGGKDSDYSNLLSQLLRLGLGAGTTYALTKGVAQPAAKKAEDQAQQAKNERMGIAKPYQDIGKGLYTGAQAGNLSASNIQAVKAARAMAAQNISRTGGVGVLQGANSIADLEARLLDNQLIQGIKIANIGDNYAVNAIQAGMAADKDLAASQAEFAKQLGVLLAPMVLGYSPNLPSGLPGGGQSLQNPGLINSIADAGGNLLNSGGNAIRSLSTPTGEI
jgi:hypothetical protein